MLDERRNNSRMLHGGGVERMLSCQLPGLMKMQKLVGLPLSGRPAQTGQKAESGTSTASNSVSSRTPLPRGHGGAAGSDPCGSTEDVLKNNRGENSMGTDEPSPASPKADGAGVKILT